MSEGAGEVAKPDHARLGAFVWHDLMTPDPAAAAGFYGELFGWGCRDARFWRGAEPVAGLVALDPDGGWPAHWLGYVAVADVNAAAGGALTNDGNVLLPPTPTPEGEFAVVEDPSGAVFAVIRGVPAVGATSGDGAIVWDELLTDDDAVRRFYTRVLGCTVRAADMGALGAGWVLERGGQPRASILRAQLPPVWLPYVAGDPDAAAAKVERLGGSVIAPPVTIEGVGRFVVIADPLGTPLAVLR